MCVGGEGDDESDGEEERGKGEKRGDSDDEKALAAVVKGEVRQGEMAWEGGRTVFVCVCERESSTHTQAQTQTQTQARKI